MTSAQTTAWNCYMLRLQRIADLQREDFEHGRPLKSLVVTPPSAEEVQLIEQALHHAALEGRQQVTSAALKPLIVAIDAIDNSKRAKRIPAVSELYAALDDAYNRLRALKDELSKPVAEDRSTEKDRA